MTELRYEVLVHDGLPRHREQRLPDGSPIVSSPVASTLIFGDRDAVLVDPPFTRDQVQRVVDWIQSSGKTLTYVYATHGHGDHWFGTDLLLQRFPGYRVRHRRRPSRRCTSRPPRAAPRCGTSTFRQVPPSPVVYQPIPSVGFALKAERLVAVEVGHTDTDDTTVLHVPSIGLVVAGDVAYNGVHQYLLESGHGGIKAWLPL